MQKNLASYQGDSFIFCQIRSVMRKIILFFIGLTISGLVFADSNVSNLPTKASPASTDQLYLVDNSAGGPYDKNTTVADLFSALTTAEVETALGFTPISASGSITGAAASLSIFGQTGLLSFTGLTSTNRAKTVRDAADTILELGGSYTPTGIWNFTSLTGTWPTFNQSTTGNATTSTTATNITGGAGGSIPYQTAANTTTMLANGSAGQMLRSAGTTLAPIWSTPTFPNTATNNQLLIGNGTNWIDSAVPTWNQNTTGTASTVTTAAQPNITSTGTLIGTKLAAGSTTVAPLTFTSGTNLTSAAAGSLEYDGTRFYVSPSTTRYSIPMSTSVTNTLLFSNAGAYTLTVPATGTAGLLGTIETWTAAQTFNSTDFLLENPAGTFAYTIASAAITAARTLNLPLITGTDTLASLGLAQTFNAAQTFNSTDFLLENPAGTFAYTIASAAITAARTLNLPLITGTDTLDSLGLAQTFTAAKTFNGSDLLLNNPANTFAYTIVPAAITAARNLNLPLITGTDTLASLGLAQTFTALQTLTGLTTTGSTTITLGGTGGLTISDTTAAGSCTSSSATTCTATVRSGCKPVCSETTSVGVFSRCSVSSTTLTCTFGTSGTNTCNFICF